jgi:type IV pilus assembly protein PilV
MPGSRAGFTLVEALVAMFVLAIGLLGCVSLLAWSLFEGNAALRREQALVIASDLAERVRASGVPDDAGLAAWRSEINSHSPVLAAWEPSLAVTPPATPTSLERVDITMRWREPRAADGGTPLVLSIYRRPPAG